MAIRDRIRSSKRRGSAMFSRRLTKRLKVGRRRGRRSTGLTTKSSTGSTFGFRGRKLSRRRWRSMLWNSTLQRTHYRSLASDTLTLVAPALANSKRITFNSAMFFGAANWWDTAGGAVPVDPSVVQPPFTGDIILRGGLVSINLTNENTDVSPLRVEVFLIRSGAQNQFGVVPATAPILWDPTVIPDFNRLIGKVLLKRTFLIENNNSASCTYRIPLQKIDQGSTNFNVQAYSYHWMTTCNTLTVGTSAIIFTRSFNVSFSADAV